MATLRKEKPCDFFSSSSEGPTLPSLSCKRLTSPINSPYPNLVLRNVVKQAECAWDKACLALFPSWQLQCQVGWDGEEQAGVLQLTGLGTEPSHPAARMGQGALENWGVTEQHVPAPSVLCQCLLTLLLPLEALEGSECMEMCCAQDAGN